MVLVVDNSSFGAGTMNASLLFRISLLMGLFLCAGVHSMNELSLNAKLALHLNGNKTDLPAPSVVIDDLFFIIKGAKYLHPKFRADLDMKWNTGEKKFDLAQAHNILRIINFAHHIDGHLTILQLAVDSTNVVADQFRRFEAMYNATPERKSQMLQSHASGIWYVADTVTAFVNLTGLEPASGKIITINNFSSGVFFW
jgi:hypothetical protein